MKLKAWQMSRAKLRLIPAFPSYAINNLGEIFSYKRKGRCFNSGFPRKLTPKETSNGYLKVSVYNNKIKKTFNIHRLVAEAFIPNPENKPQINHKNGIKTDNRIENLEWCTGKENMKHSVGSLKNGTGCKNGMAKLREKDVLEIKRLVSENASYKSVATIFNITPTTVCDIYNNKTWKHLVELIYDRTR